MNKARGSSGRYVTKLLQYLTLLVVDFIIFFLPVLVIACIEKAGHCCTLRNLPAKSIEIILRNFCGETPTTILPLQDWMMVHFAA